MWNLYKVNKILSGSEDTVQSILANLFQAILQYMKINVWIVSKIYTSLNFDQYDRPRVLWCEPVNGVLVVLSSNQINTATFVQQMRDTHLPSGEQT